MRHRLASEKGFIALISVIVISAILLSLIFTLEISSFFNRFDNLDAENKRISLGLAEACVNMAMLPSATLGCVAVEGSCPSSDKQCMIVQLSPIITHAEYNGAFTNLCVQVDESYAVTDWREMPSVGSACP